MVAGKRPVERQGARPYDTAIQDPTLGPGIRPLPPAAAGAEEPKFTTCWRPAYASLTTVGDGSGHELFVQGVGVYHFQYLSAKSGGMRLRQTPAPPEGEILSTTAWEANRVRSGSTKTESPRRAIF